MPGPSPDQPEELSCEVISLPCILHDLFDAEDAGKEAL